MAEIDSLPPVQYLIMETLAARSRLGEACWTFPKRLRPALDALQERGLLWHRPAPTYGDVQAYLTDAGRSAATCETYQTPEGKQIARLREDNLLLERNWRGDRDKLIQVRQLADSLGDRSGELRDSRPSDRRVVAPIQRMLYAILDGTNGPEQAARRSG